MLLRLRRKPSRPTERERLLRQRRRVRGASLPVARLQERGSRNSVSHIWTRSPESITSRV